MIKEKTYRVMTYYIDPICPKCDGTMKMLPGILCSSPPQYQYECRKCGYKENSTEQYPKIIYEREGNE